MSNSIASKFASTSQTRAIFYAIGLDARPCKLTYNEASKHLDDIKGGHYEGVIADLQAGGATGTPKLPKEARDRAHQALYADAHAAGLAAVAVTVPTPMTVIERANPLDDNSEIVQTYEPVADGVCGFAWINVKPGNSSFALWLKREGYGRTDSYHGGVSVWVSDFRQSYEKKYAYAQAFAQVLRDNGLTKSYAYSRLD